MRPESLRRAVKWIAVVVASTVAVAVPTFHLANSYLEQSGILELKASFVAQDAAKHIYLNEDIWQYQLIALSAVIQPPANAREANRTRIVNHLGAVVLDQGPQIERPVLTRSAPIFVEGIQVGRLEIDKSLRPLLNSAGLYSILGIMLGLAIYFTVRALPMRALDLALGELEMQNKRFDESLNSMSQGLCRFDASQKVIVANKQYRELYRLTEEQTKPGTTLRQILEYRSANGTYTGPDSTEYIERIFKNSEELQTHSDGKIIRILRHPMPDGGWLATFEDITEKRRIEQENDRNRIFLDTILDSVPAPIFVKDASQRRYILVNRAGEEFWGVSRESMIGTTSHDMFAKAEADLITAREDQLLQADQVLIDERQINTPRNGQRSIVSKRTAVRDKDGNAQYIVGVIEDVTERKRVENQISHMARHDALTGLANRTVFMEKVKEASARLRRHGEPFSVIMLDLDRDRKSVV